jgi:hypothetical protein
MPKKPPFTNLSTTPLPPLLSIKEIQSRLTKIFPSEFPDRSILVGDMAAKVIFVFIYGGFIEGHGRYLRPSHVYLFTKEQSQKKSNAERQAWIEVAHKSGFRPAGNKWYADTSRESIRDDLMRNELLRLGIMQKNTGVATTASTPINFLSSRFAELFEPSLSGKSLADAVMKWQKQHLNQATLQRMALRAKGIQSKAGDLLIDMPDGTRMRISAGPSSNIVKGLIEDYAKHHLENPAVLWLSASDKKSYPQFVELSESVGFKFDLNAELPDLILADMKDEVRFLLCEVVATDGAVTEARKQALLTLVKSSNIPESAVEFLSAFDDRESSVFRKNFSKLAVNSFVWFRTEPDLLVILRKVVGN